jgi:hypothetical protein
MSDHRTIGDAVGDAEDIIEWAQKRYHWHQKAASAERLRKAIHGLAEKYDFTADERLEVGSALQAFADDLLVSNRRQSS